MLNLIGYSYRQRNAPNCVYLLKEAHTPCGWEKIYPTCAVDVYCQTGVCKFVIIRNALPSSANIQTQDNDLH